MAKYKHYSYDQGVMIPVNFNDQIVEGTIEYTINWLVDNKIDLTVFENRYRNDSTGAPAYHPGILLKIILLAYSRGIISSREIARACRENIQFMALAAMRMVYKWLNRRSQRKSFNYRVFNEIFRYYGIERPRITEIRTNQLSLNLN